MDKQPERPDLIRRHLVARVIAALQTSRIVNIVGPRQAGKSTLVEQQVPVAQYITMDNDTARAAVEADPYGLLQSLVVRHKASGLPIAIDEVQRVPGITLALKRIVDADRRTGQFILTGSSDIFTSAKAIDSLAGRVMTLTLRPLSAAEVLGAGPCRLLDAVSANPTSPAAILAALPKPKPLTRASVIDLMIRGGFPEVRTLPDRERMDRYSSYFDSIIVKDVPAIAAVRKPDTLRRLINQLAARTAEELNIARLSGAIGTRQETINDWLDILTQLGMIHRLGAWTSSGAKKEIKAPKIHFMDTGCATALRGESADSFEIAADPAALGHILETFVHSELEKTLPLLGQRWSLFHWRGIPREIDIVAEAPGRILALFEMKASATLTSADFNHIDWFFKEGPGKPYRGAGFVVYLGDQLLPIGPGRIGVPLSMLWSY